jgi:hypothetical protein
MRKQEWWQEANRFLWLSNSTTSHQYLTIYKALGYKDLDYGKMEKNDIRYLEEKANRE